jgi:hypothetical protein
MPVQFQEKMIRDGKAGTSTLTFSLIRYEDMDDMDKDVFRDKKPLSFANQMRCASKPFLVWRSDLYPGEVHVTFEEIMAEYQGADFENMFLSIDTRFLPD